MRSDARRNRQKLLEAARQAFCEDGVDVPMEEIARRAGVGVGTLYRRFPSRDALVIAIVHEALAKQLERATAVAAAPLPAWDRLRQVLDVSEPLAVAATISRRLPASSAARLNDDPHCRQAIENLRQVTHALLLEAQREGSARGDIGIDEVVFLFAIRSTDDDPAVVAKAFDVILDGLRSHQ
jgi:AcrR family transcriptional regulator